MAYLLFKLLHVVAVVLFLGNITTGVFWVRHAARHRSPPRLAEAMTTVIRSDRVFTLPAVLAILASGGLAAWRGGGSVVHTGWIAWGTGLFVLSGLVFAALAPLQHRLRCWRPARISAGKTAHRCCGAGTASASPACCRPGWRWRRWC